MPSVLDDPNTPVIYRTSGEAPYPSAQSALPADVIPRQVTLRDRSTITTLVPFTSPDQVPPSLVAFLCAVLNDEIDKGDTYPMTQHMFPDSFAPYWFANFGAVMLLGEILSPDQVWKMDEDGADWAKQCLGSFYIKPNYPGRSSHICNGGFLVTNAARNKGVGRLMGEGYLEWAPKLGYTYSVFNLVYETNVVSLRIWDALGFKRIGRVKGAGNLKSNPDRLIDAIIFGRDLDSAPEDYLNEERFDKIRNYLRSGTYPVSSDRAEKGRLRSAAVHYRILPATDAEPEKLMLKDKEVVSEPTRQYEIAHRIHASNHGGINKTTALINEKYHWVRIKETVSLAIKHCPTCKESAKPLKTSMPQSRDSYPPDNTQPQMSGVGDGTPAAMHSDYAQYVDASNANLQASADLSGMDLQGGVVPSSMNPNRHSAAINDTNMFNAYDMLPNVDPGIMNDLPRGVPGGQPYPGMVPGDHVVQAAHHHQQQLDGYVPQDYVPLDAQDLNAQGLTDQDLDQQDPNNPGQSLQQQMQDPNVVYTFHNGQGMQDASGMGNRQQPR